ncbi:MAG TPA: DUF6029 family protein [Membranihabitans sp.]|nr:DUF6029 family protein [Membranihabitans sp.]
MDKFILFLIFTTITVNLRAQEAKNPWSFDGLWSGQLNAAVKDEKIGAANTPFYETHKWGAESWLNLRTYNRHWQISTRLEGYQNSILRNPENVYTKYGVGHFNVKYATTKFSIEGGHFYEQIGQGLIMRSYHDKTLLIDNAVFGAKVKWNLPGDQSIMAYGGWPTDQFTFQDLFNAGGEYRKNWKLKDVYLSSGAGMSWKRYHSSLTNSLIDELQYYHPEDKVAIYRQGWLATVFQELNAGPLTWNMELAFKYHDPYYHAEHSRQLVTGETILGRFETDPGQAFYTRLALDFTAISIGLEGKYINRFINKSDPFSFDYRNDLNFIPPSTDVQTYRLKARYIPATRFLGEKSVNMFVLLPLGDHLLEWKNGFIFDLDNEGLYQDYDLQWTWNREKDKWTGGMMYQVYNQSIYEGKSGNGVVKSFIPYVEYYTTWGEDKSLKAESQALLTRQDKGPLYFLGVEYAWNQHWAVFGSGMYESRAELVYPSTGLFYNYGGNRYGLSFVKQLEGYVCSGGICRYEPAYSGFKLEFQHRL